MAIARSSNRISNRYKKLSKYSDSDDSDNTTKSRILYTLGIIFFIFLLYMITHKNHNHQTTSIISIDDFETLHKKARNVKISTEKVNIMNNELFYRETLPNNWNGIENDKVQILLLHGKRYTSSTWKGLGTLQLLADRGFRTVAIDLPGYGLSKKAKTVPDIQNKQEMTKFMKELVSKLDMKNVVIICPSWGGYYGIPYLMENRNGNGNGLKGFISIASVRTNAYTKYEYESLNSDIPIGIFVGEYDKTPFAVDSKKWLGYTLNHYNIMISNSEHAAFVGNSDSFHAEILYFLNSYCKLNYVSDSYNSDSDYSYSSSTTDSNDQLFQDWNENGYDWKDDNDLDTSSSSSSYSTDYYYSSTTDDSDSSKFYESEGEGYEGKSDEYETGEMSTGEETEDYNSETDQTTGEEGNRRLNDP